MSRSRSIRGRSSLVVLLTFAVGCGNDDEGSVATSVPPASSAAAASTAPTYTATTPDSVTPPAATFVLPPTDIYVVIPPPDATYVVADPETVALVHAFIAAYNSSPDDLASFWTADSELYVENGWATPDRLAIPGSMIGQDVARHSPVVMSGKFDEGSTVLVRFWVAYTDTGGLWLQEWSPTGDTVLRMWVL